MSAITKERIEQLANGNNICKVTREERIELARIALASLEAEAVAYVDPFAFHNFIVYRAGETDNKRMGREWMWANPDAGLIPVYTAPPVPVSVPEWTNEQCLEFLSIAFRHAEIKGDLELDDIRLGVKMVNGSRAAMLKHSEPFIVTSDHRMMEMPQVEAINAVTAILQGAEPVTTAYKLPDGWVACSERMPEESGRYWCYVEEQNDLGKSHYQWNCSWNGDRWWVESENGGRVTHWMPLPPAPQQEVKP
ncbi:DUF551 domain-containing protein [Enterobacter hormaechei]|uniref:DUF551 domain-containing protein n=1 Tax=Enterobacter hormaechei TaxID=158836 RepID=UPI0020928E80|nr:DUF551 domain-containing protein [Enterobacter hormaechei]MCO6013079.1 DUF551 domain-containing protein [Enterobacter hormaechei]